MRLEALLSHARAHHPATRQLLDEVRQSFPAIEARTAAGSATR